MRLKMRLLTAIMMTGWEALSPDRTSHKESLTGTGLLCLELCGEHGKPATIKAGEFVLRNHQRLRNYQFEYYGNYYSAQGMFQLGVNTGKRIRADV